MLMDGIVHMIDFSRRIVIIPYLNLLGVLMDIGHDPVFNLFSFSPGNLED